MKKFFFGIAMLVALSITFTAKADNKGWGDLVNLGELQLNQEYEIPADFSDYIATFTAPASGTLTAYSTASDILYPYVAHLDDMEAEGNRIPVVDDNLYGNSQYHFDVVEGVTYVFYKSFMLNAMTFRISMDSGNEIAVDKITPEKGSVFSVSGSGLVTVQFNRSVNINRTAKIIVGSNEYDVDVNGQHNIFSIEIKTILFPLIDEGVLQGGESFKIRFTDIAAIEDNAQLYNGDGVLEIEYIISSKPVQLVASENTSGAFKTYYLPTDPTGIIRLEFDGAISTAAGNLTFGTTDVEGDYYIETINPVIQENVITIDITGKHRNPKDMVMSGTNYGNIVITLNDVRDTQGQYIYTPNSGVIGGLSFAYDELVDVTANVMSDFVPTSGTTLNDDYKEIEIWITDEQKLIYEGINFAYTDAEGKKGEIIVTDFRKEIDSFNEDAMLLYVSIPQELNGKYSFTVTLHNLMSVDGNDHSKDVYAEYFVGTMAVDKVFGDDTKLYEVYNTKGVLVLRTENRDAVKNLPEDIYIINGKKFLLCK